jgi:hypothetical protein
MIISIAHDAIHISGYPIANSELEYSHGWIVESIEEPKEEETAEEKFKKRLCSSLIPLRENPICKHLFQEEEKKEEASWSTVYIRNPFLINQPTKPTIMSYLSKARQAVKDLVTPEDVKILREAGWETEPHIRSQEGTEALLDLLYAEKRDELVEKAKEIKEEFDAEKE